MNWTFFFGLLTGAGAIVCHYRRLNQSIVSERKGWQKEVRDWQEKTNRFEGDLKFAESMAANLRAEQQLTTAYNRGYSDGSTDRKNRTEIDKFAYNLGNKQPARLQRTGNNRIKEVLQ